ncbi:hypothetical protein MAR_027220 [Mya arenaria]|uniref:Uncharacterized protein n=1 Tax=Mya arenaria TaxID=6604 RepID=A0ABY7EST7_MYAAR|nr:hypothetical protein MAR_027220 [Mya arenaria]
MLLSYYRRFKSAPNGLLSSPTPSSQAQCGEWFGPRIKRSMVSAPHKAASGLSQQRVEVKPDPPLGPLET